jgi:drug/metabolite transporter (DMT)-like permease
MPELEAVPADPLTRPFVPNPTRGFIIGLCAAAFLSTTGVLIRYLSVTYHMPALVMAFWRDLFVVLTILPVLAWWRPDLLKVPRQAFRYLAVYGIVLTLFNVFWTLSVTLNGAAVATVLVYCSGAFTVALGRLLLKEALTPGKLLASALSLAGCVLVSDAMHATAWRANFAGILTGVLSGLAYAGYSLMGRSAARRGLDPWTTLVYIFGFGTVYLFLCNLIPGGPLPGSATRPADFLWLGSSVQGWGVLLLLSAVPTVAGFGLYLVSLTHLSSGVANLVVSLEPAFTALGAYLLLGEKLGATQAAGALSIMVGVAVLRIDEVWRTAHPLPDQGV